MRFEPHPYQRMCIEKALTIPALGLFLDMGLGKTVIALTAAAELKLGRFEVAKILVIAPKKVAESTWLKEADKWEHLKGLRVQTVLGTAKKREAALLARADVYVINRENVVWLVNHYKNAWPFDMVIIDEFSSFKSHEAKRFKALTMVRSRINRIIGLTGTPAPNGLIDLWAELYLLDRGARLGQYISHYRDAYFNPDARNAQQIYSYKPKKGSETAIWQRIRDICISLKADDYLSLPPVITDIRPVYLDAQAAKRYNTMEREMLLKIDEKEIDARSAAALSNKLLQLCNGAVYDDEKNPVEVHTCKLDAFMELIDELNGEPVMVFYSFRHDLTRIKKALAKTSLRVRELKTPNDETAWNSREVDVLLAHPASSAYGLNLQDGGNQVIWYGLNWSLELFQQANKRLHRQGQRQTVFIHILTVAGGMDEDVAAALNEKADVQERLLNALKARVARTKGAKA